MDNNFNDANHTQGANPAGHVGAKPVGAKPVGAKPAGAKPVGARPAAPQGARPVPPQGARPVPPQGAKPAGAPARPAAPSAAPAQQAAAPVTPAQPAAETFHPQAAEPVQAHSAAPAQQAATSAAPTPVSRPVSSQTGKMPTLPKDAKKPQEPVNAYHAVQTTAKAAEPEEEFIPISAPLPQRKTNFIPIIIAVAAVLVVAGLIGFIAIRKNQTAGALTNQIAAADKLKNAGEYDKALKAYDKAIDMKKNCPEAYLGIGDVYLAMVAEAEAAGDLEKCKEYLDTAKNKMNRGAREAGTDAVKEKRDKVLSEIERIETVEKQLAEAEEAKQKAEEEKKKKEEEEKARKAEEEKKRLEEEEQKRIEEEERQKEEEEKKKAEEEARKQEEQKKEEQKQDQPAGEGEITDGGVVTVNCKGLGGTKQIKYQVRGNNHIAVVADMGEVFKAISTCKEKGGRISSKPENVDLITVTLTDGILTYTMIYRFVPVYTDKPKKGSFDPAQFNTQSYLTVNGNWLAALNPSVEGDTITWDFDLPEGYVLNDKITITECYGNSKFYSKN